MAFTAIVIADLIDSKKLSANVGGVVTIDRLREAMSQFITFKLDELNLGQQVLINNIESQGDNVQFRLEAANLDKLADLAIATIIAAFTGGPSSDRFRYLAFSIDTNKHYQPRIKFFSELSKDEKGSKYHIAIERSLHSAIADATVSRWLESQEHEDCVVNFKGEPYTGAYVDLYCLIEKHNRGAQRRWRTRNYSELLGPDVIGKLKKQEGLSSNLKAQIIKSVYFHLDHTYGQLDIGSLATKAMLIEGEIQGLMHKALLDYFESSFRTFVNLPDSFFTIRNLMFQIRYGQRIDRPILEVRILPKEYSSNASLEDEIQLDGCGYFTTVVIAADSNLKSHFNRICQLIKLIYETSYQWLIENLLKKLNELEINGSVPLYNYIRVVFKTESKAFLANKIWLGVFTEDKGYYLLDKDTSKHVLELLEKREYRSTKSPAYHLLHLIGLIMPYDKSASRHAIQENKPIDFELSKVAYISDDFDLMKTEEQMVQGGMYSVYVISGTKNMRLVAGFPTRYKSEILPVLEKHQNEIAVLYETQLQNLERYIQLLRKNFAHINWSQIGDFIGGLMGGFTKSLFQP